MTTGSGFLKTYDNVSVATADPATLVVHLFDGALRFLRTAGRALASGRQADFAYAVTRAHAIIAELSNVLDREAGGDVVRNLDALYDFMLRHLTAGLAAKSSTHLDQVAAVLKNLRDAFDAARQTANAGERRASTA
jgi:flagellar secretion chaperone FliS